MTRLQRIRPLRLRFALYLIGAVVMIGSLLGAKVLTGGHDENAKAESPDGNPGKIIGPVVLGTVDSNTERIRYGLPFVLQSGTISEVFVQDGAEVHAGDKLYVFDTAPLQGALEVAQSAVVFAKTKVDEAEEAERQHVTKVKLLEQAVKIADRTKDLKIEAHNLIQRSLENYYESEKIPKSQWKDKLRDEDKLFSAQVAYITALSELELKQSELIALKTGAKMAAIMVEQAKAGVKQADAEVTRAQTAVDHCTIRAKIDGTIEQVTISRGSTIGISTPKPALWLIPAGSRIVRAEIVPDFAHRVSSNLKGKEVTIFDNTDPKLTYKGKVKRIGTAFLPKRSPEGFPSSDTNSLEADIEVIDASPADRPPLRIGQRVRVDLGQ